MARSSAWTAGGFQTASGMAAAFAAMNNVFGTVFDVSEAEAADPMVAQARAEGTKGQFIMDVQTHWVRDDYNQEGFVELPEGRQQTREERARPQQDHGLRRQVRELRPADLLNSDTSVAILSGAPFDDHTWEFVSNQAIRTA